MDRKNALVIVSASLVIVVAVISSPALRTYMQGKVITADLVVKNAVIYTSDPSHPWAEAMAFRNNRILAIGDFSSMQEFVGQRTQSKDLHGKMVVPGFIDSHVHFISGGLQMAQVDLHDVQSKVEFIMKVEQAVNDMEKGDWVLGGGWNNDRWGGELPQASWIDNITHDHPVWLSRMDGHMGLANSLALAKAGIHSESRDIVGGAIIKSNDGAPTGLLVDAAMELLLPHIPEATVQKRRDAMMRASKLGLSRGVTTVVDFGRYFPGTSTRHVWDDFSEVYKWADETGHMLLRVCLFFPLETWSLVASTLKASGRNLSQWLHIGGVKTFLDGSLGSNSALFYEPYADDEHNHGLRVADPDLLLDTVIESDKSGIQVAIHAIGDMANDMVLSINEALISKNGVKDRRFRIEHAQHLAPGAVDRFGQNGVIASVQFLQRKYKAELEGQEKEALQRYGKAPDHLQSAVQVRKDWTTSWWEQFCVLSKRTYRERYRDYFDNLRLFQATGVAILLGLLWWKSKIETEAQVRDQVGLMFYICIFWTSSSLFGAVYVFPFEKDYLVKDRTADMYRLSVYYICSTLCDMVAHILYPVIFMSIVYFMAGFHRTVSSFFLTLLVILLIVLTGQGAGEFFGAATLSIKRVGTVASLFLLLFLLTGGYYVQHIPVFISWLKYISFLYYGFRLLLKVQYSADEMYDCGGERGCRSLQSSPSLSTIELNGGAEETGILICMALVYRICAYICLRRRIALSTA